MLRPLNNNVVLKKEKIQTQTASGIILSKSEEETEYAVVVAVGEGIKNEKGEIMPCNVKVNDKVIYKSYSPTKVNYNNDEYLIVDCKDILAVIE